MEVDGLRPRTKILALGTSAVLLMSGIALTLMSSIDVSAEDGTFIVTVEEGSAENVCQLTVNVFCNVDGAKVTLAGADVTACTVNITEVGNATTIVIERVALGLTDADGNVTFDLPEGKYVVCAAYQGLHGFGDVDLTEDQVRSIFLHGSGWNDMDAQRFRFYNDARSGCDSASQEMSCNGTFGMNGIQDRDHDRVGDRCGGGNGGSLN